MGTIYRETIYAGAIIGFVLGLVGFIIVRFWILPIRRYNGIKARIISNMSDYCALLDATTGSQVSKEQLKVLRKSLRRQASDLTTVYNEILPHWYKLLLESRPESPLEASTHLMALSNIHQHDHTLKRTQKIRHHLRIK